MSVSVGSSVYGLDGLSYRLAEQIGKGGQGSVWSLDGRADLAAKFYHKGFTGDDVAKLSAMCRLKSDSLVSVAAWPITLLKGTRTGVPNGLLMRKIAGYQSVHQLYGLKSRLRTFPQAQFPFLLHSAINIARAFGTIHGAGQVIGDVNHSNLMISQTATAALIDCDSFQIKEGTQLFPCPVGVPEFTPPELQGQDFSKQNRTAQHDCFGLAVLIFYMLFVGRHPFMGLYDPKRDEMVTLDQAIGRLAFPYALDPRSPEVKLPPFAPRLFDYPTLIGDQFKQAFTSEALTCGRPSALQWVNALSSLAGALRQCAANPNHHFYNALTDCPWCRMEGLLGMPVFGIKITAIHDRYFNITAIWAEIEAIHPQAEQLAKPNLEALASMCRADPAIPEIVRSRRLCRLSSIGVVLLVSVVGVTVFPAFFAILAIAVSLVIAGKVWKNGSLRAKPFLDSYRDASAAYKDTETALDESSCTPSTFLEEKRKLEQSKVDFMGLGAEKAKRLASLQAGRESKQRQRFLEQFRIEDEKIPTIGAKFSMTLRNWGIEDAWDVEERKISAIKGFGPVKVTALLQWRRSKEALFRFDPNRPVDPRDLDALEQEFSQKTTQLQNVLRSGSQTLRQTLSVWQARRRQTAARLHALAKDLARAQVNRDALGRF
jgi:DNA-binding helix-hairpin-helix protein with protein kinase domain